MYPRFDQIQLRLLRNDFIDMGSQKRELIADLRPQRALHRRLELGLLRAGESASNSSVSPKSNPHTIRHDTNPFLNISTSGRMDGRRYK